MKADASKFPIIDALSPPRPAILPPFRAHSPKKQGAPGSLQELSGTRRWSRLTAYSTTYCRCLWGERPNSAFEGGR